MTGVRLIEIKEEILSDNQDLANNIRKILRAHKVYMLNLMASPGAGKTSLILRTIEGLRDDYKISVIEGDIDSAIDAEKISKEGIYAVQIKTGGFCHLDASMIEMALKEIDVENFDLIIIENIGNLVCPAEFDTGASKSAMILSVPEGDDKPLKYPIMFSKCDALLINKIDYLSIADFDVAAVKERVLRLNPNVRIFEVSCKTKEGLDPWIGWLKDEIIRCQS